MTTTPAPRPIAALDVPLADVEQQTARQRIDARAQRLSDLIAHPETAPHIPAPAGELAEYRHLLHDADPDSTIPAFHDFQKGHHA